MGWKIIGCITLASFLVLGAAGCGDQTFSGGVGTLTITSVAPNPVPGMTQTMVTITGSDFSNQVGAMVEVEWRASSGTPFLGGTSQVAITDGVITSATTVDTVTPRVVICGPASITAFVKVIMPSGVFGMSTTAIMTFTAPTITSFAGGGIFPAAVPTPFVLNGTGFGDIGSPVVIHWSSASPIFDAGSSTTTTTPGVVATATTITGTSPLALVCGPVSIAATVTRVSFQDESCTPTGTAVPATFTAPTITAVVNTGGGPDNGTSNFAAALPEPFTVTGSGYGPVGGTATVNITSTGAAIFGNGSSTTTAVNGTIQNTTTITVPASALAVMCQAGLVTQAVTFSVLLPDGSCSPSAVNGAYIAPAITSITNTQAGSPHSATNDFAAAVPEPFDIVGTRFGPVGGIAVVQWTDTTPLNIYAAGTSTTTTVLGQVVSSTLIQGISPEAALCSPGVLTSPQDLVVTLEGGSCSQPLVGGADIIPPRIDLGSIANVDRGGFVFLAAIPETFLLHGSDFGPIGGTAMVTFTSAATNPASAATPFNGGTTAAITVLGTITSRTTVQGTSPEALLCPTPGVDPATGLNADIDLSVTLEGGSCTPVVQNQTALIQGPTLVSADLLVPTPPAQGLAGGPALNVPTTVVLGQDEMPYVRITGTGFAPLGAIAMVTLEDIGNGTGPSDLNGGTTISGPGVVISETVIEVQLPVIDMTRLALSEVVRTTVTLAPNGSCTFDDAMVNLVAPPTVTSVVNNEVGGTGFFNAGFGAGDMFAGTSSNTTINGTGFATLATRIVVYSTNDGLDPNTDLPVRSLGTGAPAAGVVPTDYDFDLNGGGIINGSSTSITGGVLRAEYLAPDLDTDGDGLVPYTLRTVNPDGQYSDFAAGSYRLASATANLGSSANIRNNNSVAVNPLSFTDDFQNPGADATDTVGVTGVEIVAIANDEVPGGGFGLFNGTDIFLARTVDGGATWTSGPLGAAGIDTLPATAARSYAKVAFDTFGNAVITYVVDDFAGVNFDAHHVMLWSQDSGATWSQPFLALGISNPFTAGTWNSSDLACGPDSTAGQQVFFSVWADASLNFVPYVNIDRRWLITSGLGAQVSATVSLAGAINDAPGPAFGIQSVECAVGNAGEFYVAWQEPQFGGPPPFTTNFLFDYDLRTGGGFQTDQAAFSDFIPFFALPAYADIQFFEPVMDLCVARAGTHAGRLLWVYDHIYPNGGGNPVDHAGVLARVSDAPGSAWSSAVGTHPVDTADRFMPAVCSDRATGRFYLTWYDTTSSLGAGNTTFERYGGASADGVSWGTVRNLSGARGPSQHVPDFDTDFGAYAGVDAHSGFVCATWGDTIDSGSSADPIVVGYEQK